MTGAELERAIDFILKSQARAEARIERNEKQLGLLSDEVRQLASQLSSYADPQANIMRVMMQTFEAQVRINES